MKFSIEVEMSDRWAPYFVDFLKYLEKNGNIGHSSLVGFYADGDGDFRPRFKIHAKTKPVEYITPSERLEVEAIFDAG